MNTLSGDYSKHKTKNSPPLKNELNIRPDEKQDSLHDETI